MLILSRKYLKTEYIISKRLPSQCFCDLNFKVFDNNKRYFKRSVSPLKVIKVLYRIKNKLSSALIERSNEYSFVLLTLSMIVRISLKLIFEEAVLV